MLHLTAKSKEKEYRVRKFSLPLQCSKNYPEYTILRISLYRDLCLFWCVAYVVMACAWLGKPLNKRKPKKVFLFNILPMSNNVIFPTDYSVSESTARFVYCIQQAQSLYNVVVEAVAQTYGEEFADHIMKNFDSKYFDMQRVLESWMHESITENLCSLDKHNVI